MTRCSDEVCTQSTNINTDSTKKDGMEEAEDGHPDVVPFAHDDPLSANDANVRSSIQRSGSSPSIPDPISSPNYQPTRKTNESGNSVLNDDSEKAITMQNTASTSEPPYTILTRPQKLFVVIMASLGSLFSPLSSSIYFPALNTLATHFDVSPSLINFTITTYQIFQGLAPSFYGDFADQAGSRPAWIVAFVIYIVANIGLAVQDSYAVLMVLRCLQSAGSSATVALSLGVIADVTVTAERGTYMGLALGGALVAMAFSPVVGGLLSQYLGWVSIFWFLVIFSGVYFIVYLVLMPETSRKIVGNGSIKPQSWWNKSGMDIWRARKSSKEGIEYSMSEGKQQIGWPRPWKVLVVLWEKDVAMLLFFSGVVNIAFYVVLATTPLLFGSVYGLNNVQVGLCYLPIGIGSLFCSIINGHILDWNFRRVAKLHGIPYDREKAQDLRHFPIEKVRIQTIFPILLPGLITIICYGWALEKGSPLAGPLVLQFIVGFCLMAGANTVSTLLVDLYPEKPATVTAANNLVRCLMGAGGMAVIQPMIDAMTLGWCYTFIGLVSIALSSVLVVIQNYGQRWHEERWLALEEKRRKEDEKTSDPRPESV